MRHSPLDNINLEKVPFGKNRLLKRLGEVMFSVALQLTKTDLVHAHHVQAQSPCWGFAYCHGCNSNAQSPHSGHTAAVLTGCNSITGSHWGVHGHCWYTYINPILYKCCDYQKNSDNSYCICRSEHYAG